MITHGPSSVLWKASSDETNGVLNISGGLWNILHAGRSGAWKLWKNDKTLLTEGTIDDSLGNSTKPFSLTSGSGGSRALRNIPYAPGDTFRLEILESNYVAVKLTFKAKRTNDLASDFSLEANPTSTGWQYSESLENGGVVVGPAIKHVEVAFNLDHWVQEAWRIALARAPSPDEKREALQMIETLTNSGADIKSPEYLPPMLVGLSLKQATALTGFCLALFNLNEFMYID